MSRVCQATAAICKRLQFWLAETVCSDFKRAVRGIISYKQKNGNRGFEVVA